MTSIQTSALSEFLAAMSDAGLVPHADLDLQDGTLQRFRVRGDKAGSCNGWAVFYGGQQPAGAFGSWRTGQQRTWCADPPSQETATQRAERRRQMEALRVQRQADEAQMRRAARDRARHLWAVARPATNAHPYLQAKAVHAYGIRQLRDRLVIPARDASGELHTLQFIGADSTKRFMTGGRIEGCYFAIGCPTSSLFVCEGYATAATVHHATGQAVAAAFSAGNLKPVVLSLRAKFPDIRLVIAADNDAQTPGNPGVRAAFEAAAAAGALVAVPDFSALQS